MIIFRALAFLMTIDQRSFPARTTTCHFYAPAPIHNPTKYAENLVNLHTLSLQISPRQIDLLHEFCVCLGDVVECEDAVAEFEEEVGTE